MRTKPQAPPTPHRAIDWAMGRIKIASSALSSTRALFTGFNMCPQPRFRFFVDSRCRRGWHRQLPSLWSGGQRSNIGPGPREHVSSIQRCCPHRVVRKTDNGVTVAILTWRRPLQLHASAQSKSGQRRLDAWHNERTLTELESRGRTATG